KKSLSSVRATPKGKRDGRRQAKINQALLAETTRNPRAIAMPITQPDLTVQAYLGRATRVQNTLPFNATWNGDMAGQLTAAEVLEMAEEKPRKVR
ncbi:MAG: hypothetical protein LZF63_09925, partial [Nitrosomonas sp.]|nr:hypothetical protein [Nitrosomonas sp.]